MMTRIIYIGFLALAALLVAMMTTAKGKATASPLGKIHEKIVTDYPEISHMSRAELEAQLTSSEIVILDTRPIEEYNVSHIPGALQVNPDIDLETFQTKFGTSLKNKSVVVYCSVGRRSSALGHRLQNTALASGAISVKNMEGGLFGWHNDNRPLIDASGTTSSIHPYNAYWGRLIENKETIRYRP